jgi:hypothetical protein
MSSRSGQSLSSRTGIGAPVEQVATLHAIWFAAAIVLFLFSACLLLTHGHFVYSLDDPYIHLALARNIARGGYGINPGQWAAPSSSILWPVLLTPFVNTPVAVWMPLLINVVCLLVTVSLSERFFRQFCAPPYAALLALALAWGANLFGLVFTGMEHNLQLLLVTVVAVSLGGLAVQPWLLLACLAVLPCIRYEDLAISLPVMVYLFVTAKEPRQRRTIVIVLCLSVVVIGGFSLFLRQHGLGILPSSIVAKQSLLGDDSLKHRLAAALMEIGGNWTALNVFLLAVFALVVTPSLRRIKPHLAWLLLATTVPIVLFGRCGWFGRYEAHYVAYVTIMISAILLPLTSSASIARFAWPMALGFLMSHPSLWLPTIETPLASRSVYEQQYQMGLIVRDFLKEPIAVNDLGLVAWLGNKPVLDLWGLGSKDALDMRGRDPSDHWLESAVESHGINYAFIYTSRFRQIPQPWIRVGQLRLAHTPAAAVGAPIVDLYATNAAATPHLVSALTNYRNLSALNASLITILYP